MKIKSIIIEDKKEEKERLIHCLQQWDLSENAGIEILTFDSGESYFKKNSVHNASVFFLDIQLGGMTGLEIAQKLRKENYKGHIIFLTAFREYVFQGYQVHALNYILKPVTPESLYPCLDEISRELNGNAYIFRQNKDIIQIPYQEILCFSSNMHYVDILTTKNVVCQYTSLNHIIGNLPLEFIRVHKSYIVNMYHIYKITRKELSLSNNKTIPIGRAYYQQVTDAFFKYSNRFE